MVAAFLTAALTGGLLLSLPWAAEDGHRTSFVHALFTATSAVCVTGLAIVDTPTHWSLFGELVILGLIQIGGFGIMTLSSLIVVVLSKRLGLRHQLLAAQEAGSLGQGDVRRLLLGVARFTLSVEATAATILALRFWITHGEPLGRAAYLGVFHAVSAFNNAGFGLYSDNLMGHARDPLTLLVIAFSIVVGGLGYPVWVEIARSPRKPLRWSLHAKITVVATLGLLLTGAALTAWFEWTNARTMGPLSGVDTIVNSFFHSASTRTAGFNAVDIGGLREPTRMLTEVLMFIGGGSASTAGGIKVSTFALLGWVMWAEARGDTEVVVFERRISEATQRQAVTVALMAVGVVIGATMLLVAITQLPRNELFFEVISALGTVGLSLGITPDLPDRAALVITAVMLLGRVGPVTLFAGLVLRDSGRRYRHPVESPLVG